MADELEPHPCVPASVCQCGVQHIHFLSCLLRVPSQTEHSFMYSCMSVWQYIPTCKYVCMHACAMDQSMYE